MVKNGATSALLSDASPPHPVVCVSNLGRVMNANKIIPWGSGLSAIKDGGYRRAGIDGKNYYVHRLVNLTFNGPAPSSDHTDVNHIDGDRTNNAAHNLEWNTRATKSGRFAAVSPGRKLALISGQLGFAVAVMKKSGRPYFATSAIESRYS